MMRVHQALAIATVFLFIPLAVNAQSNSDYVSGRILLQVHANGEAWYVDPVQNERTYLRDGASAFRILEEKGLGISNEDLARMPIGVYDSFHGFDFDNDGLSDKLEESIGTDPESIDSDGDGYLDRTEIEYRYNPLGSGSSYTDVDLVERLKGRIVLQVEDVGQAWYVHPEDGRRYYMGDGDIAYQMMKSFGLGITDEDLAPIPVDVSSEQVDCELNDVDCFLHQVVACSPSTLVYRSFAGTVKPFEERSGADYEVLGWDDETQRCDVAQYSRQNDPTSGAFEKEMVCALTEEEASVAFSSEKYPVHGIIAVLPGVMTHMQTTLHEQCSGDLAEYLQAIPEEHWYAPRIN